MLTGLLLDRAEEGADFLWRGRCVCVCVCVCVCTVML